MNILPQPPKQIFQSKTGRESVFEERLIQKKLLKIIDESKGDVCIDPRHGTNEHRHGFELHPTLGFLTHHISFPYPEKGWRDDYAVAANWNVKRVLITWIRFFSYKYLLPIYPFALILYPWRIKILEKWLLEFASVAGHYLQHYYLEDRYLQPLCRELKTGTRVFIRAFGVSETAAESFALTLATCIGFDTAYYFPLEDILSETSKDKLLKKPRKEVMRLVGVSLNRLKSRGVIEKVQSISRLLGFALLIPGIRRAFREAIRAVDFPLLQFDEIDHYHARNMGGYDYFGLSLEERLKIWPPTQHTLVEVEYNQ